MKIPVFGKILEKIKSNERPPLEKFYFFLFIAFLAFLVGDLATLYVRQHLLPTTVPPKKMAPLTDMQARSYTYPEIINHNIFNADGVIPPPLGDGKGGGAVDGQPRLSDLPLDLLGTIVHANPNKSLASIVLRGQNKVEPYGVGNQIEGMAEIKEIQRERVIFRNLRSQALEYIEIPRDDRIVIATERFSPTAAAPTNEKTNFEFKREEINQQLENLPSLLQQARAIPDTGPDGTVRGFRLVEIQPGSIYEKLGVQLNDVIRGVNGMELTSPQQAMEAYQSLKSSNEIKLVVERNGREMTLNYNLR